VSRALVVAEMTLRELARRRAAVALLVLVPLAFYLARRDLTGQSIRFLGIGLGWAVSTFAAFATVAAARVDVRLRLGGYRARDLLTGRLAALLAVGAVLVAAFCTLILLDQPVRRPGAVVLMQALTVVVAVPLGLLLAAALRRELEASLALIVLAGVQFVLDPAQPAARLLPFWSTREVGTYAVDLTDVGYLQRGVLHALVTAAVCLLAFAALSATRPSLHTPRRPATPSPSR
jgi:hypothetical protein